MEDLRQEAKSVLCCPVVVHRWFDTGEGWAWPPDQAEDHFISRLKELLAERPSGDEAQTVLLEGGPPRWFCHHVADHDPSDPKAKQRRPSILRAVALPSRPKDAYSRQLGERLAGCSLPDKPGPNPQLCLEVPRSWLEPVVEAKDAAPTAPQGQPARNRDMGQRGIWRTLLMVGIVGIVVVALVGWFCWGGVSAYDVRERLLAPLGVKLDSRTSEDQVYEEFRSLYCKQEMVKHFFQRARSSGEDAKGVVEKIKGLAEKVEKLLAEGGTAQGLAGSGCEHPDVSFVRQNAEAIRKFWKAIEHLPDEPIDNPRIPNWVPLHEWLSSLFQNGGKLRRVVNEVAKGIPESERGGKKVAGSNPVRILEDHIVNNLVNNPKDFGERTGDSFSPKVQYEKWFCNEFRWAPGTPFPWDQPDDSDSRSAALLFCRTTAHMDQKESARAMSHFLKKRGVQGIAQDDVDKRPWFVGRAFLEFLSLKPFTLSWRNAIGWIRKTVSCGSA